MSASYSVSSQLKTFFLFPLFPYVIGHEIRERAGIRSVELPLLIIWGAEFILRWNFWEKQDYHWAIMALSILFRVVVELFLKALLVHLLASAFNSSAGLVKNIVCIAYALSLPSLILIVLKHASSGHLLALPATVFLFYIGAVSLSAVNRTSLFRGLFLFSAICLIINSIDAFNAIMSDGYSEILKFRKMAQLLTLKSNINILMFLLFPIMAFASSFLLVVFSFCVDVVKNRALRKAAQILSVFFLSLSALYFAAKYSYAAFFSVPANLALDYHVKNDSIFILAIRDKLLRVAEYNLTTGAQISSSEYANTSNAKIISDANGKLYLIEHTDHAISLFEMNNGGEPVFSIAKENASYNATGYMLGNSVAFDSKGNLIYGRSTGELQKYSKDGRKISEIKVSLIAGGSADERKDKTSNPNVLLSFAIDSEDNIYAYMRDFSIQKINQSGEVIKSLKFEDGISPHYFDIAISGNDRVYVILDKKGHDANESSVIVREIGFDKRENRDATIYDSGIKEKKANSHYMDYLRMVTDDVFILRRMPRGIPPYSEYEMFSFKKGFIARFPVGLRKFTPERILSRREAGAIKEALKR
ncbi:MAG: hypothetical protein BWY28_02872 [bacterium ADurb.Bin236]|nr:MAG: hypothetical protein BWY28_02872 [bacterium ADurb.Bin236]HPN94106.1 hypothetical protein [bacterium]